MKRIYLVVFLLALLSESVGCFTLRKLKADAKGFAAPVGFATILAALQLVYYPAQILQLSFRWLLIPTAVILTVALYALVREWKTVVKNWMKPRGIIVLFSAVIFTIVLKKCSIDLDFSDSSTYLNYIAMNINAPKINLFDPTSGLRGEEWYLYYLFEGFFHFGSVLCWVVNIPYYLLGASSYVANMVISVYGFGILFNILSAMLIVNIVLSFRIRDIPLLCSLMLYMLFYANFSYWNISFAFFGNTYRNLFVTMALYTIYQWLKEEEEGYKYLLVPIVGAALSCSSSSLFMCFAVLYALAAHLFHIKRIGTLRDMTTIIIPLVAFVGAFVSRGIPALSVLVFVGYPVFLFVRNKGFVHKAMLYVEDFFFEHCKAIFFIGIPLLFAVGSVYFEFFNGDPVVNYKYYFNDFPHMDMTKDYIFLHSKWQDNILNLLRWCGVILVLAKAKKPQNLFIKDFTIIMLVWFLNPLCINMLAKTITGMVFNRNFMTLFNPMTETVFFLFINHWIGDRKFLRGGMCIVLLSATILGNVCSFKPLLKDVGQYEVYITKGKDLDAISKLDPDELNAILAMKEAIEQKEYTDRQPVLVSQSGAALSYIPEAYQLFAPWNEYYPSVDDDFYQIARRHFDWVDYEKTPAYENTCMYIQKHNVDYVLLQYWENSAFDQNLDGCTVTIYEGSKYKVREVNK